MEGLSAWDGTAWGYGGQLEGRRRAREEDEARAENPISIVFETRVRGSRPSVSPFHDSTSMNTPRSPTGRPGDPPTSICFPEYTTRIVSTGERPSPTRKRTHSGGPTARGIGGVLQTQVRLPGMENAPTCIFAPHPHPSVSSPPRSSAPFVRSRPPDTPLAVSARKEVDKGKKEGNWAENAISTHC